MEVKLQLILFMLFIQASVAVWERVTVREGRTLSLTCSLRKAHRNHVEWRNPDHHIMFFNDVQALQDRRYRIDELSRSRFNISISKVTFKDGGNYTCSEHHNSHTEEKRVEVTVLGHPRMKVVKHDGKFVIQCSAEANHYPPQISWSLAGGIEVSGPTGHAVIRHEDGIRKYTSVDDIQIQTVENTDVKCLVRHPALYTNPLMDFVTIRGSSTKSPLRTSTSSPTTAQPQRSTDVSSTTTRRLSDRASATPLTTHLFRPSSENSTKLNDSSTEPETVTPSTGFHLNASSTSHHSTVGSTHTWNNTVSNASSSTGSTLVSGVTEDSPPYNSSEGNSTTGSSNELERQLGNAGNKSLLVLLVTCLIVALLVVVIFFGIKLRRAHIIWKKENEESEPSSESSKSKSSQEEKQTQEQRRRGLFNIAFTQYVAETPTVITIPSTSTTPAMAAESIKEEETPQAQILTATPAKTDMKETEL